MRTFAKFRASKDARLVSDDGAHSQIVTAGEEADVFHKLFRQAIDAGMVPMESLDENLTVVEEPKEKLPQRELEHNRLIEVCEQLIAQGNPRDYTIHGYPKVSVVRAKVDFDMTAAHVRDAFDEAMHRVRTNGDDDSERSEPSISASV